MDSNLKQILSRTALVFGTVLMVSACHFQDYNHAEQADVREGQTHVYGEDTVARQSKIQYPAKPELAERTEAIRQKLFGEPGQNEAGN
jgi:hypothetical protein